MNLEKLYSQFKLLYLFGCVVIRDKQGSERFRMHVMTKINGWLQVYYFTNIFEHCDGAYNTTDQDKPLLSC